MLLVTMNNEHLFVFVPCHNRQAITCSFIQHLHDQVPKEHRTKIHLLDDGSTDGTSELIARLWPDCVIHRLNGQEYWGGCLRYIQNYCRYDLDDGINPLILIANDDICFQAGSLENGIKLMQSGEHDALIPVLVDVPVSSWSKLTLANQSLSDLCRQDDLSINFGDHYDCGLNQYSRLDKPGATNIGVTAALLIRRDSLLKSAAIPRGIPHYGSDFWLTHSLACEGEKLCTNENYVILRRQESTRVSSRNQGRRKYWKECCNPSSPDYLPGSIIFQRRFSKDPSKAIRLWIMTLKYTIIRFISGGEGCKAELAISLQALLLARTDLP